MTAQIFSIGVLLAAFVSQGIQGQQMTFVSDELETIANRKAMSPVSWNYDKNGTDWADNITSCGNKTFHSQSPMVMNVSDTSYTDWKKEKFSFVPNFQKTKIKSMNTDTWALTVDIEPVAGGSLQGFYAAEPKRILHKFVKWETQYIQFHYPSEHTWSTISKDGVNQTVKADMELQIYGQDHQEIAVSCKKSGMSALSLFFFLNKTGSEATNKFFEFTKSKASSGQDFDLSLLVDDSLPMMYPTYGYIGSLTQPPCTNSVCWYLVQRTYPITQEQLDYFKVKGVESNARQTNTGYNYRPLYNKSIFGPNNEIVVPVE